MMFRRSSRWLVLLGVVTLAVVLAGCGTDSAESDGSSSPDGVSVEIGLTEFVIETSTTTVPVGVPVTFNVTNNGVIDHELALELAGADDEPLTNADGSAAEVEDIGPGDTVSLTYTFEEAGTYQIACHVPGHYEAGMLVEITVE